MAKTIILSIFYPRLSIAKSICDCRLSDVMNMVIDLESDTWNSEYWL